MTHENDSSAAGLSAGYSYRPVPCSTRPIIYNQSLCIGCNRCASVCQCDILFPARG